MKNNIKKPLKNLNDIDKKILPFFSSPIILKRINDQKKNNDWNIFNPQKKFIFKIIKLNEKLVEFTTWIKKYNLNLDSWARRRSQQSRVDNNQTATEFILFVRNNLYYNLKFRLSNILYKIEKFIPVLKFHSLLNNINLFVPKRLLKPQPYIRFTYRIIQINNYFKNTNISALRYAGKAALPAYAGPGRSLGEVALKSILPEDFAAQAQPSVGTAPLLPTALRTPVLAGALSVGRVQSQALETSPRSRAEVLIKIQNYNEKSSFDLTFIQLHKFENGRSIKYILLKLNNLLNEIDNIINIKNKLIKIIKIKSATLPRDAAEQSAEPMLATIPANQQAEPRIAAGGAKASQAATPGNAAEQGNKANEVRSGSAARTWGLRHSNQSVKNLRLKIKKINSYNNIEVSPLFVEAAPAHLPLLPSQLNREGAGVHSQVQGMVKENIIKIENNIKSILAPSISAKRTGGDQGLAVANHSGIVGIGQLGAAAENFNVEKDIINENSNPVDLLYFNNNLKRPVINQYLKSMSTYNMITNGIILYYSNIIGFNFKKRIRTYLPFINSVPVISLQAKSLQDNNKSIIRSNVEPRLTSPYSLRGLRKVVGSLDKGKFSVFGRGIENNKLINNIYKFLYLSFRSMYCLISKPVFIIKSNKITIQLFYFLLIPKIFKNIKSESGDKPRNKKRYRDFIEKRKFLAWANRFESRFYVKARALRVKYFLTLPTQMAEARQAGVQGAEQSFKGSTSALPSSGSNAIFNLDYQSINNLLISYAEEWQKIRRYEEERNGVKYDKFGMVELKSLEDKLRNKGLLNSYNFIKKKQVPNRRYRRLMWNLSQIFLKRKLYNRNKDFHIVRIPIQWKALLQRLYKKNKAAAAPAQALLHQMSDKRMLNIKQRSHQFLHLQAQKRLMRSGFAAKPYSRENNQKLFPYLAIIYFNIFKLSHPLLDRIKFKLKWFQKELIEDKSYLLSYNNYNANAVQMHGYASTRRNKFNSYNQINRFLFNKLFWSISLSKKIIPNAKILQKLGIPKWSWPYRSINKKGYDRQAQLHITKSIFSYSWPFSLLMSTNILNINNKVNKAPLASASQTTAGSSLSKTSRLAIRGPAFSEPVAGGVEARSGSRLLVLKNKPLKINTKNNINRIEIRSELYTKRYHLMKLANINLIKIYPLKFEKLCEVLNSIFNKPVELDLIRLQYPYHDSNILVRLLAFMINKMKFRRITRRLFNKAVVKSVKKINTKEYVNIIPAFLSGITIKVAGRIMKYRVTPRKTVKIIRRGASSIGKVNFKDVSRYTNKNRRGSFTITITSGQNFFN